VIPRDEAVIVATRGEPTTTAVSPATSVPPRATARAAAEVSPKDLPGQLPFVYLDPGKHQVEGAFAWDEMPEMIDIPATSGLVALVLNDAPVDFPVLEAPASSGCRNEGARAPKKTDWR